MIFKSEIQFKVVLMLSINPFLDPYMCIYVCQFFFACRVDGHDAFQMVSSWGAYLYLYVPTSSEFML